MQIVFDAEQRQAWYQEVYQLLQLQSIHPQLVNLTSQTALQLNREWRENQAESIAKLVMTARENTVPGVSMTATIALQALYIENPVFNSLASETALGLAWLAACSQGEAKCRCFLSGLVTHAIINQQQAVSALPPPETAQINQLRTLFTELKQVALSNPKIFTRTLASSFNGTEGSYLLKVNHHVLMLASRIEQGQQHYYLYDPKVGQISCKGADPIANSRALNALLKRYLQGKKSALESIEIYKVNTGNAREQLPTLARLESTLEELHDAPPRSTMTAAVRIGKVRISAQTLRQMGATVGDEPLSFQHLNETHWRSRLYFDPIKLSHYLSTVKRSDTSSHTAIQLLNTLTTSHKDTPLFTARAAPAAIAIANELLGKISEHVEKGEIKPALWSSLRNVSAGHLARLEKFSHQGGRLMQGYGYTRGIQDLINYNRLLNRTDLTQEEKRDLLFERHFAIASLTSNFLIDGSQYGLAKLGSHLASTGSAPVIEVAQCGLRPFTPLLAGRLGASRATVGLELLGSRLGQISFNAGSKFTRIGGPTLGVLASGFDIYNAYRSFSQLAQTTDPEIRQDLIVNGSFSVLGAAVSIGVNIAFAMGGTAAVVAGPLGLAVGAAIIASAQIYSAVRQIEAIRQHITLTTAESWENGWRLFLGENLTPEVQRRWTEQVEKPAIRQEYDRLLEKYADTVLKQASPLQRLGSYYYSRGDFHLEQHVKRELDLSALDLLQNATPYYLVLNGGFTYKDSVSFIPTQFYGINDFVDANAPFSPTSTVRKAVLAHPPQEVLADSEEMVALFDLGDGDGDDIAIGHRNKRNSFNINRANNI
ncbi:putative RTX-family protein-10 [Candidatus Regiella insecticola]|uniref:Putative RTX-family protein-10 n=2 Tax=Candidatus Regiella insecticola TaxID=138073 RepID=A0A6L2ZKT1_9ENTR|nr:putative RTX-family protein-10 [Candidatus Regiella insecticola]